LWSKGQKIAALSPYPSPPDGARVIDVTGKYVLPGFIDAHTHIGIYEEIYRIEGDDTNETSDPITPHLRALDAVNMEDLAFQDAVQGGVTTVMTGPGSANVIGGLSVVMKTHARTADEAVVKNPAGLKVALGENLSAFMEPEKNTNNTHGYSGTHAGNPGSQHKTMQPISKRGKKIRINCRIEILNWKLCFP